jgi:hypothetical protein
VESGTARQNIGWLGSSKIQAESRKASSSFSDFKADRNFPHSAIPVTSDSCLQSPVFSFFLRSEMPRETSSGRSMNGLATW